MQEIKNGRFVYEEEYARQRSFSEFIRAENEKYLIDNGGAPQGVCYDSRMSAKRG